MLGTILTGYLSSFISPRLVLIGIYGLRAVLIVIVTFIPMSVTTVMIFSVFFGVSSITLCFIDPPNSNHPFYSSYGYLLFHQQPSL
jgi:predicted MFS family arabinose efflux permease